MAEISHLQEVELDLQSPRITELQDYMLDGTPSTGFICVPAREQLKRDQKLDVSERRMPFVQLRGEEDVQRDLNMMYTTLLGIDTGRYRSAIFVEPENPVMPPDFDPKVPSHHRIPYRMTWQFFRKIYFTGALTSGRHTVDSAFHEAARVTDHCVNPLNIDDYTRLGQPRVNGKVMNLSAVYPTYETTPVPHSRYSPIAAYSLLPEVEAVAAKEGLATGEFSKSIALVMLEARIARERVFANATYPYIIPNDVRFGEDFYKAAFDLIIRKYEMDFSGASCDIIDIVHDVQAFFLRDALRHPEKMREQIRLEAVMSTTEKVLRERGVPFALRKE